MKTDRREAFDTWANGTGQAVLNSVEVWEAACEWMSAQQPESEPAAHVFPDDLEKLQTTECSVTAYSVEMMSPDRGDTVALYLGPRLVAQVPEGWKLMPETLPDDMLRAAQRAWLKDPLRKTTTLYSALYSAAPAAPSIAEEEPPECLCADPDAPIDHSDFGSRFCPGPAKCTNRPSIAEKENNDG